MAVGSAGPAVGREAPWAARLAGGVWSSTTVREPGRTALGTLGSVSCTAADACTAVGGDGPLIGGSGQFLGTSLAARWNGSTWSIEKTPDLVGSIGDLLIGVSCVSARECIAVGTAYFADEADSLGAIWR